MKTSLLLAVTNALILGCLWVPSARADKPAEPWSYRVVCPNGKFVFVMIAPAFANERPEDWGEDRAKEIREIRARYTQSGLYRNDGSNDPLWTVDWYSFHVYVASDGVHLVRENPLSYKYDDEAVSFFANGQLVRTYRIIDLVEDPENLPHTAFFFEWKEHDWFDDENLTYKVRTKERKEILFDAQTGAILPTLSHRVSTVVWITICAFAAAGFLSWFMLRWFRTRATPLPR